ncbi:MAG: hypothetical protein ACRD2C_25275 [Acidimicrobiales bacterium]
MNTSPTTTADIDAALQQEVDIFLRRWGDIGWRGDIDDVEPLANADVLRQ